MSRAKRGESNLLVQIGDCFVALLLAMTPVVTSRAQRLSGQQSCSIFRAAAGLERVGATGCLSLGESETFPIAP